MEREIHTRFIAGATCPFCGVNFGQEFGRQSHTRVRNMIIPVMTNSGVSKMKMRVCRTHTFTDEDLQWLVECHKMYFKQSPEDAEGTPLESAAIDGWQYDNQNQ